MNDPSCVGAAEGTGAPAVLVAPAWPATSREETSTSWGNRAISGVLVAGFLLASHALIPDADSRAWFQYLFVITLGYGHLAGALVFSRRRERTPVTAGSTAPIVAAFLAVSVLSLFAAYSWMLSRWPVLVVLPLSVSVWHTVENDLRLSRAYRSGLRLGPLPRNAEHHELALGLSAALVLLAGATPEWHESPFSIDGVAVGQIGLMLSRAICLGVGALLLWQRRHALSGLCGAALCIWGVFVSSNGPSWIRLSDVFVATTLYHLVSWLVFFSDRTRRLFASGDPRGARRLLGRLVRIHVVPVAICLTLLLSGTDGLEPLRTAVFSPAIYLFWSTAHVVQTAVQGQVGARRHPSPVAEEAPEAT